MSAGANIKVSVLISNHLYFHCKLKSCLLVQKKPVLTFFLSMFLVSKVEEQKCNDEAKQSEWVLDRSLSPPSPNT